MSAFFAIVSVLLAALHVYVALRLVSPLRAAGRLRYALYGLFVPLWALGPGMFFVNDALQDPWQLAYRWLAWTYLGWFSMLFALVAARDLTALALRGLDALLRRRAKARGVLPTSPERRRFLMRASGGGLVGASAAIAGFGIGRARRVPAVIEVEVPIADLPREFDGVSVHAVRC